MPESDPPTGPMIELREARKHYGGRDASGVEALRGVDLSVARGEFVSIMGPSGCGKSTLLHVIGGLDKLSSGEVKLDGEAIHQLDDTALTLLRRRKIGFVFQFFNLLPTLTVEENVKLPALLDGASCPLSKTELDERCTALLGDVGLGQRATHRTHEISGGEMQRAALARALLLRPAVILADEPTGNLDSVNSERVMELFTSLGEKHGTTIVMVTHSREIALAADRMITMRDGLVVESESKATQSAKATASA